MWRHLKTTDHYLCRQLPLLLLECLVIIFRLPSLFEPYWYGDEGIYLTIGTALRQGERLYADIIDHKTPLIYYLAMTPSQLLFRVLMLGWMMTATWAFYQLSRRLFTSQLAVMGATLFFILTTNFPGYEGNIPNGELFVMGFVLVAAWVLLPTHYVTHFLTNQRHQSPPTWQWWSLNSGRIWVAGGLLGLGILTKVPGLFDAAAWAAIGWFAGAQTVLTTLIQRSKNWHHVGNQLKQILYSEILLMTGIVTPIVISVVYFASRGSLGEYIDFGLLYNFRYAGSWQPDFSSAMVAMLFTLPGKFLVLTSVILSITVGRLWLKLSPQYQLIAGWLSLATFAALLSNRPYPHYFLQIMPPLSLLVGQLIADGQSLWATVSHQPNQTSTTVIRPVSQTVISGLLLVLLFQVLTALNVHRYPTQAYYHRFFHLVTGQLSWVEYRQSFDSLVNDNYRAAQLIQQTRAERLFIWGTNPILYAQSQTAPTGRFTVSFHIKDFQAQGETFADLQRHQPQFIVVMNNESAELPGLNEYLDRYYMPNDHFDHFTLWKRYQQGIM